MREMKLQDLKSKSPVELLGFAEEHSVENASTMRKQELMFAILKQLATKDIDIIGEGVVEVLQDGLGFMRAPEANYLPGPDDIYVSPSQIRRFGLRTGDTIEGEIRSPKEGERSRFHMTTATHGRRTPLLLLLRLAQTNPDEFAWPQLTNCDFIKMFAAIRPGPERWDLKPMWTTSAQRANTDS